MSNYMQFFCKDCDEESSRTINHGEETLRDIYRLRRHIFALVDADMSVDLDPPFYANNPVDFLLTHRHCKEMHVHDEYGECLGRLKKR